MFAASAFKTLAGYLDQLVTKRVPYNLLWEIEEVNININIIEVIYFKVVMFALHFDSDFPNICFLEADNVGYKQKYMQQHSIHPISLLMSRFIMFTPLEVLSHCIYKTSKTKSILIFLLTETSSLHFQPLGTFIFGYSEQGFASQGQLDGRKLWPYSF